MRTFLPSRHNLRVLFTLLMVFIAICTLSRPALRSLKLFAPPASVVDGHLLVLGSDQNGKDFLKLLLQATGTSLLLALLGSILALFVALIVGTLQGALEKPWLQQSLMWLLLGMMAIPDIALIISARHAWPRDASAWVVNLSLLSLLALLSVPPAARLLADRIRALRQSLFVRASEHMGSRLDERVRFEMLPHLWTDMAWLLALLFPRMIHIETGLAYLGVGYKDLQGLGELLRVSLSCWSKTNVATFQLFVLLVVVVLLSLLPQLLLRRMGWLSSHNTVKS